jgi:hypothetical protein
MKWLKSLSIWAILGAIGAAIVMILGARRDGKLQADIKHGEAQIKELNKGTVDDVLKAKKIQDQIKSKKIQAYAVRTRSEKALSRVADDSETMADVASNFNRVRKPANPTSKSGPRRKKP